MNNDTIQMSRDSIHIKSKCTHTHARTIMYTAVIKPYIQHNEHNAIQHTLQDVPSSVDVNSFDQLTIELSARHTLK